MSPSKRQPWSQPQLVVLVRGTPEENVLMGCKGGTVVDGNAAQNGGCYKTQSPGDPFPCMSPCPQATNS